MSLTNEIIANINKTTSHKYVKLTDSGNKAIYAAFYYLKEAGYKKLIIPDQGGWITYKQYPKKLKLDIIELKTDKGLVVKQELDKVCKNAQDQFKKDGVKTALIITSLAGYYANHDLNIIFEVCKKYGVLLIEDTNAYGMDGLCNGKLADIIVGSFGEHKVVNNYHGGFISSKDKKIIDVIEKSERVKEKIKPKELDELKLLQNLKLAHERLLFLIETCEQIKKELIDMGLNVLHPGKKGIVVVVGFKDGKSGEIDKNKIIDYCKRNELEFEECPRYIRVNEPAISIEVKRLEHIGNNDVM